MGVFVLMTMNSASSSYVASTAEKPANRASSNTTHFNHIVRFKSYNSSQHIFVFYKIIMVNE